MSGFAGVLNYATAPTIGRAILYADKMTGSMQGATAAKNREPTKKKTASPHQH